MSIEITLIRHGETVFNSEKRIQGKLDSPLTDRGRKSTERLGRYLKTWMEPVDSWYVSPLGRAQETSEIIRHELKDVQIPEPRTENLIREIDCGDYEGKTDIHMNQEVRKRLRLEPDFPYPGGESIVDVMKRGESFLDKLMEESKSFPKKYHAVVVSHGNFNRSFGSVLTGLGPYFALRVIQNNTAVNQLISVDRHPVFRILNWNDTTHIRMKL
ncbi:MAG: histidine phosphatase family protein [Spirochaetia bacterium]|nr:histidine phosphatase family protein [Spirochaetia bacterium]